MDMVRLSSSDLVICALLVCVLAGLSWALRLGIGKQLLIAAARSVIQLSLLGMVLKVLFATTNPWLIALLATFMLAVAGYEVMARQQRKFKGYWGYSIGVVSMFLSSFSITLLALTVIINVDPWWEPQYLIPLLGMLLGNTMSGIAIALDNLTRTAWEQRFQIEAKLMLGQDWNRAIQSIRRNALSSGLIPIINAMTTAGIVSLPGMMTGQILAGSPPMEAAKYQMMILFLIAAGSGLGSLSAIWAGSKHLFDERQRLRLDRLKHRPEKN